jgi:hypothetical protein
MTDPASEYVDRGRDEPELQRLEALVARLSDADLGRTLYEDWTISGILGHLAFWDRRAAYLVGCWQRGERSPSPSDGLEDVDSVNEAAKPQWLALSPRAAAHEAVAAARAANRALDSASPELIQQIIAARPPISLARASHRREHLDEIEQALGT